MGGRHKPISEAWYRLEKHNKINRQQGCSRAYGYKGSLKQLRAMSNILQNTTNWIVVGTPGKYSSQVGRRTGGMLVMWDERRFVLEEKRVVVSSRLMKVKLQDIVAGEGLTF